MEERISALAGISQQRMVKLILRRCLHRDGNYQRAVSSVATRRGKQFNSMVQERKDAITGAVREAVLMSQVDAQQLGLKDGDAVILKNELGELRGRVYIAPIKPGNLQVHWPEGNVLLDKSKRSKEGVPDYNTLVHLEKMEG
jgi:anaerobic selenocysteine-containing dehydrogenase